MAAIMLEAMLVMALAFWAYAFAVVFARVRTIILERERGATWTRALLPQQEQPA
jgi:heme exporter protein C